MDIKETVLKSTIKQRLIAIGTAALIGGGYWYNAPAATVSPEVAVTNNMNKEVVTKFTVLSGKDFGSKSFVLNDTVDFKVATLTVYVDKVKCPSLSYASLQGKTISVRGSVGEWTDKMGKKKPEIKVTNPSQISVIN